MDGSHSSLIAGLMPDYAIRQVDHVAVAADPAAAYSAARSVDMYRIPFVRGLFELRICLIGCRVGKAQAAGGAACVVHR